MQCARRVKVGAVPAIHVPNPSIRVLLCVPCAPNHSLLLSVVSKKNGMWVTATVAPFN